MCQTYQGCRAPEEPEDYETPDPTDLPNPTAPMPTEPNEPEEATCSNPLYMAPPISKAECENMRASRTYGIRECHEDLDTWAGAVKQCGGIQNMATAEDIINYLFPLFYEEPLSDVHFYPSNGQNYGLNGKCKSSFYAQEVWLANEYGEEATTVQFNQRSIIYPGSRPRHYRIYYMCK